ncbi:MAG: hypothetical protein J5661_00195 [Bacteroidaceae bacterium]|nr:hypothetical protein [Bacteroidaceae bacterium]
MKKIYQAPKMKEIRLSSEAVLVRDSTSQVLSRKHDAMFDDYEEDD